MKLLAQAIISLAMSDLRNQRRGSPRSATRYDFIDAYDSAVNFLTSMEPRWLRQRQAWCIEAEVDEAAVREEAMGVLKEQGRVAA